MDNLWNEITRIRKDGQRVSAPWIENDFEEEFKEVEDYTDRITHILQSNRIKQDQLNEFYLFVKIYDKFEKDGQLTSELVNTLNKSNLTAKFTFAKEQIEKSRQLALEVYNLPADSIILEILSNRSQNQAFISQTPIEIIAGNMSVIESELRVSDENFTKVKKEILEELKKEIATGIITGEIIAEIHPHMARLKELERVFMNEAPAKFVKYNEIIFSANALMLAEESNSFYPF